MCNELELLTTAELATILRTTPAAIDIACHRQQFGQKIPPCIYLGRKRLWRKTTVLEFLAKKTQENIHPTFKAR
jgi:hypothetical protein